MLDEYCEVEKNIVIRYWEEGSTIYPTIVLLHGIGAAIETWETLLPILSSSFHVIAMDFPGFGKSKKLDIPYTPDLLLRFFEKFCIKKGVQDCILIGHSLGGGIAIGYTLNHADNVKKIILISSGGLGDASLWFRLLASKFSEKFILPWVGNNHIGPLVFRFFYGAKLPNKILENLSSYWDDSGVIRTFVRLMRSAGTGQRKELIERLPEIQCPVLVVWGENDLVLGINNSYPAIRKISNCKFVLIRNAGHGVHTEKPELVNPLIYDFCI
jgi:pimeloyl-ACP methyl ester carboxylesterase